MVETPARQLWGLRATYLALAVLILFFSLIPLETVPRRWAAPDLLLALTFAWALRRPDYVPALSIAAAWLLSDLLLHRPPGLMATLVLVASEILKPRAAQMRDEGFASELATVAIMLILVTLAYRVILAVLLLPVPPLGLSAFQLAVTLLCYPLVVLVSNVVFGVRAKAPGDTATGGIRI